MGYTPKGDPLGAWSPAERRAGLVYLEEELDRIKAEALAHGQKRLIPTKPDVPVAVEPTEEWQASARSLADAIIYDWSRTHGPDQPTS